MNNTFEEKRAVDSLTGVHTRKWILNTLQHALDRNAIVTVFMIDLDKFKIINDLQGHHVGDIVLQEVGKRLNAMQNEKLLFGRIGGDEFLALYYGDNIEQINETGKQIKSAIQKQIIYDSFEYEIEASIGIARYPKDGNSLTSLLVLADYSMYHNKKNKIEDHLCLLGSIHKKVQHKQKIKELLQSIDYEKDLSFRFQPQFDIRNGKVLGVESIVQWEHERKGVINRSEFLPVAEEIGTIQYITKRLFIHSIAQIKEWNDKYSGELCMNLNVSQSCIYHKVFFTNASAIIKDYGIDPHWLGISLNERSLMHAPQYMRQLLAAISEMGITLSVHDFGTDMITIGQIKELFINRLQVGTETISGCEEDDNKFQTLRGISMLAKGLELKTAAVGVENAEQYSLLKELDYEVMQGDYLEKPMLSHEFEEKYLICQ